MRFGLVLLITTLAGLSTGVGGILAVLVKPGDRLLAGAMGFAAGVMIAVSLADLCPGAAGYYLKAFSPLGAGAALASLFAMGMLLAALLERCLPEEAAFAGAGEGKRGMALRSAVATGLALLLHNLPEGILTLFTGAADPHLGARTALAIAMHNIPEGLAVSVPLFYATQSRAKAAGAAFASGLAEPLGAVLAWGLLHEALSPSSLNGMTVLVAGIMTWVGAAQLLPAGWAFGRPGCTSFGFGVGSAFMLLGIAALQ